MKIWKVFSRFSSNTEAFASELLENVSNMFLRYWKWLMSRSDWFRKKYCSFSSDVHFFNKLLNCDTGVNIVCGALNRWGTWQVGPWHDRHNILPGKSNSVYHDKVIRRTYILNLLKEYLKERICQILIDSCFIQTYPSFLIIHHSDITCHSKKTTGSKTVTWKKERLNPLENT